MDEFTYKKISYGKKGGNVPPKPYGTFIPFRYSTKQSVEKRNIVLLNALKTNKNERG